MNVYTLILAVVSSAAFGAVLGKILDAFLLSHINEKIEKKRWLRETKFESFAKLSEEILALGLKERVFDDPWRFKGLGAKAVLLIEDQTLVNEINNFINDLSQMSAGITKVESNIPDDFVVELSDGKKLGKKHIEKGFLVSILEKKGDSIVEKLGIDIRRT
jgi:hypothetical protein